MRIRHVSGWTLTEMVMVMAVIGLLSMSMSRFFSTSGKAVVKASSGLAGDRDIQKAVGIMELDFMGMNEVTMSSMTSVIHFMLDSHRLPGYNPNADPDGDGLPNYIDGDDDGDMDAWPASAATAWKIGNDLDDDDDDNNNLKDVECRYELLSGGSLVRRFSYNEAAWTTPVVIMTRVMSFQLSYYGSIGRPLGASVDLGADGVPGTNDPGEGDRIITAEEIDMTPPVAGHGNRNGLLDTEDERRYISAVGVYLAIDRNGDGKADSETTVELSPPQLGIKRPLGDI